jgi:hypothetical protein
VTEPERTESHSRGPLPRPLPGLTFDDVTGRVIRTEVPAASSEEPDAASPDVPASAPAPAPAPREPSPVPAPVAPSPAPSTAEPEARVPDRGVSREQRRTEGWAMVPLLARALATQLEQIAAEESTPDGWWFTPDR